MMHLRKAALCLSLLAAPLGAAKPAADAVITIRPLAADRWQADYALPRPAARMAFARNPDDSRVRAWKPADPAFEIVRVEDVEQVRRRDRRPFRAVALTLAPVYVDLPKDYAPFSAFTDGGLLFHSGRFFACADRCADKPRFDMRFIGRSKDHVLAAGRSSLRRAAWSDGEDGTSVYIGAGRPIETAHVLAVIDPGLPAPVRDPLRTIFPRFMDYFTARLGAPQPKPMLFASYDPAFTRGYGSQGGTLPGQVFIHYYGPGWPDRMAKPGFLWSTAFFFAHEAGHLHQKGGEPIDTSWINEGGADMFAARALAALMPDAAGWLDRKLAGSRDECAKALARTSLEAAMASDEVDMLYQCGLTINDRIDRSLRAADPRSDGIFTLWRAWRQRLATGGKGDAATYLDSVAVIGGKPLADWARRIAFERFSTADAARQAIESR